MRFFLVASLFLHIGITYFLFSSEEILLPAPSDVEIAVIEHKKAAPTDLESENILPSAYEKIQKADFPEIPAAQPAVRPNKSAPKALAVQPGAIPTVVNAAPAPVQSITSGDLGLKAKYPRLSRVLSEEGRVIVLVHTNEKGHVKKMSVSNSSGFVRLDEAALDAVGNSRMVTYEKNSQIKISFLFKLK